ncbi:MAG: hypothetical protein ACREFJ_14470 [Acetobacteraceae bacterium]
MNPIPFIAASYAIAIMVPAVLGFAALARMRRAERRLRAVEQIHPRRVRARPRP